MPAPEPRYRPHPDVVATDVGQAEIAILRLTTQCYFKLNGTGTRIWRALQDGATTPRLAEALLTRYDVTPAEARRCADEFVRDLLGKGLIEEQLPEQ